MQTLTKNNNPKICISCNLVSEINQISIWIDCLDSREFIEQQIADLRARSLSSDSSWTIIGYENFQGMEVDPYHDLDDLLGIAYCVAKHGEAYVAYLEMYGFHSEETFKEAYLGKYETQDEFGYEHWESEYGEFFTFDHKCHDLDQYSQILFSTSHYWYKGHVFKRGCE